MRKSIENILVALFSLACLLGFDGKASALVVDGAAVEDLILEADRIIHGAVVRKRVEKNPTSGRVWTVYSIAPFASRGHTMSSGAAIDVRLPGGTHDGLRHWVPGIPELAVGAEAWWLLERVSDAWVPVGYRLGVLTVTAAPGPGIINGYVHVNSLAGEPVRWEKSCLSWYLDLADYSAISRQEVVAALEPSFEVWNQVAGAYPRWQFAGATCADGVGKEPNGVRNVVVFRSAPGSWPHPQRVIALTSISVDDGTGFIVDADVEVNAVTQRLSVTGDPNAFDLRQVATHEVGHMLGLDHTPVAEAVMFGTTLVGERDNYELHPDDDNGLSASHPLSEASESTPCAPADVFTVDAPYCPASDDGCATTGGLGFPVPLALWLGCAWFFVRIRRPDPVPADVSSPPRQPV